MQYQVRPISYRVTWLYSVSLSFAMMVSAIMKSLALDRQEIKRGDNQCKTCGNAVGVFVARSLWASVENTIVSPVCATDVF